MTPRELIELLDDFLEDEDTSTGGPEPLESPFDEDDQAETDRWDEEITKVCARWAARN